MINAQIRQFRDSIMAVTNANPLPIEIKRLVLAEVYTIISDKADIVILAEKSNQISEKEKENRDGKKDN